MLFQACGTLQPQAERCGPQEGADHRLRQGAQGTCDRARDQLHEELLPLSRLSSPSEEELAVWGNIGYDHVFLTETRQPLTKSSVPHIIHPLRRLPGLTDSTPPPPS